MGNSHYAIWDEPSPNPLTCVPWAGRLGRFAPPPQRPSPQASAHVANSASRGARRSPFTAHAMASHCNGPMA